MTNLDFFKACLSQEFKGTYDVIMALPSDKMDYKPHENSRSAHEIVEHIVAHASDFTTALTQDTCDELFHISFNGPEDAAQLLKKYWDKAIEILNSLSEDDWSIAKVDFKVHGQTYMVMPRMNLMWMFLFDTLHHRGQLSTYIRPMGGKNPAVYGYSFDTLNG